MTETIKASAVRAGMYLLYADHYMLISGVRTDGNIVNMVDSDGETIFIDYADTDVEVFYYV